MFKVNNKDTRTTPMASSILQSHQLPEHLVDATSQPAIKCSKLTIETLEQGVKYVQS